MSITVIGFLIVIFCGGYCFGYFLGRKEGKSDACKDYTKVIYCEDCGYSYGSLHNCRCGLFYGMGGYHEFCSRAERKEGEE